MVGGVGVEEGVAVAGEERLVDVHARAVLAEDRLGHEGRVDAVLERHLLDDEAIGHGVVGHGHGVGVAQVDLVLGRGDLVVAVLDADAHLLEHEGRLAAQVARHVLRRQVEVPALVHNLGPVGGAEVKVLELRADEEAVALLGGLGERALECPARVGLLRLARRLEHVAEHPGDPPVAIVVPREDDERRGIGHGDHIALLDPRHPLHRRAVEPDPLVERPLELVDRDRHRLQEPQDVGEPQPHEPHALARGCLEHLLLRHGFRHGPVLLLSKCFPGICGTALRPRRSLPRTHRAAISPACQAQAPWGLCPQTPGIRRFTATGMPVYNAPAATEDRATLGSDPSAVAVPYGMGGAFRGAACYPPVHRQRDRLPGPVPSLCDPS